MIKLGYSKEEKMLSLQKDLEVRRKHNDTWLEAIVEYCQEYDLEESDVIPFLSPVILDRINEESKRLRLIKNSPGDSVSLPF